MAVNGVIMVGPKDKMLYFQHSKKHLIIYKELKGTNMIVADLE